MYRNVKKEHTNSPKELNYKAKQEINFKIYKNYQCKRGVGRLLMHIIANIPFLTASLNCSNKTICISNFILYNILHEYLDQILNVL